MQRFRVADWMRFPASGTPPTTGMRKPSEPGLRPASTLVTMSPTKTATFRSSLNGSSILGTASTRWTCPRESVCRGSSFGHPCATTTQIGTEVKRPTSWTGNGSTTTSRTQFGVCRCFTTLERLVFLIIIFIFVRYLKYLTGGWVVWGSMIFERNYEHNPTIIEKSNFAIPCLIKFGKN